MAASLFTGSRSISHSAAASPSIANSNCARGKSHARIHHWLLSVALNPTPTIKNYGDHSQYPDQRPAP